MGPAPAFSAGLSTTAPQGPKRPPQHLPGPSRTQEGLTRVGSSGSPWCARRIHGAAHCGAGRRGVVPCGLPPCPPSSAPWQFSPKKGTQRQSTGAPVHLKCAMPGRSHGCGSGLARLSNQKAPRPSGFALACGGQLFSGGEGRGGPPILGARVRQPCLKKPFRPIRGLGLMSMAAGRAVCRTGTTHDHKINGRHKVRNYNQMRAEQIRWLVDFRRVVASFYASIRAYV